MRSTSPRVSPEVEAQLQAAREQIEILMARINELEANAESWGAGMAGEPPPEYV
jgi:prefoldin subunit 5